MDLEHLKLILEALKGVGEGALAFGIAWLAVKLLLPITVGWLIAHTVWRIWRRWCESREQSGQLAVEQARVAVESDRALNQAKNADAECLLLQLKAKEVESTATIRAAEEKTKQVQAEAQNKLSDDAWNIIAGRAGLSSRFLNTADKERILTLIDKGHREESAKP